MMVDRWICVVSKVSDWQLDSDGNVLAAGYESETGVFGVKLWRYLYVKWLVMLMCPKPYCPVCMNDPTPCRRWLWGCILGRAARYVNSNRTRQNLAGWVGMKRLPVLLVRILPRHRACNMNLLVLRIPVNGDYAETRGLPLFPCHAFQSS